MLSKSLRNLSNAFVILVAVVIPQPPCMSQQTQNSGPALRAKTYEDYRAEYDYYNRELSRSAQKLYGNAQRTIQGFADAQSLVLYFADLGVIDAAKAVNLGLTLGEASDAVALAGKEDFPEAYKKAGGVVAELLEESKSIEKALPKIGGIPVLKALNSLRAAATTIQGYSEAAEGITAHGEFAERHTELIIKRRIAEEGMYQAMLSGTNRNSQEKKKDVERQKKKVAKKDDKTKIIDEPKPTRTAEVDDFDDVSRWRLGGDRAIGDDKTEAGRNQIKAFYERHPILSGLQQYAKFRSPEDEFQDAGGDALLVPSPTFDPSKLTEAEREGWLRNQEILDRALRREDLLRKEEADLVYDLRRVLTQLEEAKTRGFDLEQNQLARSEFLVRANEIAMAEANSEQQMLAARSAMSDQQFLASLLRLASRLSEYGARSSSPNSPSPANSPTSPASDSSACGAGYYMNPNFLAGRKWTPGQSVCVKY